MHAIYHNMIHIDTDINKKREIDAAISNDAHFNNHTIPTLGTINFNKICPKPRTLIGDKAVKWRLDNWGTHSHAFGYSNKYLESFNAGDICFNTIGIGDPLLPVGNIHPIMIKLSEMYNDIPFVYTYTTKKYPITGRCKYINGEIVNLVHMTDTLITTDYSTKYIPDNVLEELNSIHFRK